MADQADLGGIRSRLSQRGIYGAGEVEGFQSPICLLSLAVAHTPEIKTESEHASLCQTVCQCHRQNIMHIATGWLRVAEDNDRSLLCVFRFVESALEKKRRLSPALKGQNALSIR